jgi:hypothetical protein
MGDPVAIPALEHGIIRDIGEAQFEAKLDEAALDGWLMDSFLIAPNGDYVALIRRPVREQSGA